jgi:hypothetical protein
MICGVLSRKRSCYRLFIEVQNPHHNFDCKIIVGDFVNTLMFRLKKCSWSKVLFRSSVSNKISFQGLMNAKHLTIVFGVGLTYHHRSKLFMTDFSGQGTPSVIMIATICREVLWIQTQAISNRNLSSEVRILTLKTVKLLKLLFFNCFCWVHLYFRNSSAFLLSLSALWLMKSIKIGMNFHGPGWA